MNYKNCPYCGASLPEGAHFCPICAKPLIQKEAPKPAVIRKKPKLWLIAAALLIVASILGSLLRGNPKTFDDDMSASLVYETGGKTYHLILRNAVNDELHWRDPQAVYERKVPPGQQLAIPLQLYVFDEETGENALEAFSALLKSSEITVENQRGADVPAPTSPASNPNFPKALLESDIVCSSQCTLDILTWTLHMKNKDTLLLHETVQINELPTVSYSYENTPLSTLDEVQTLIDTFQEGDETQITIVLAPILYEGELSFGNLNITLQGTRDGVSSTQIDGSITITDSNLVNIHITEIDFIGHGDGSGIIGYGTFFAEYCTFTDLGAGIDGRDGSWPIPYACTFENCRVGFLVDSSKCRARSSYFDELTFINNEIAVQMIRMPADDILYFMNCTFDGNQQDFDVQSGNKIQID